MSLGTAFLISLAAAVVGTCCVWWGRRGRRVGDHLHCRKCEHDLFGLPWDATRCPECGTFIKHGKPRGRLERRPRFINAGLILIVVSLPVLSSVIYTQARGVKLIEHKPLWYVLQRIKSSAAGPSGDDHLNELKRRIDVGKLDASDIKQVIRMLLEYQADTSRPWSPKVGKLIENFRNGGKVRDREWDGYLEHGADVTAMVRRTTQTGDPIAAAVYVNSNRFGAWSGGFELTIEQVGIDGNLVSPDHDRAQGPISPRGVGRLALAVEEQLPAGEHEMAIEYTLVVAEMRLLPTAGLPVPTTSPIFAARKHGKLKLRFEVRDDHPTIQPALADGATKIVVPFGRGMSQPNIFGPSVRRLRNGDIELVIGARRVDGIVLAYDIFLRHDQTEYPAGSFCIPEDQTYSHSFTWSVAGIPWTTPALDVILRPSRPAAVRQAEVTRFQDTEYTFKDVIIRR